MKPDARVLPPSDALTSMRELTGAHQPAMCKDEQPSLL
jgi:hypothetical protein